MSDEEEHNEKIARFLSVTDSEDGELAAQMVYVWMYAILQ